MKKLVGKHRSAQSNQHLGLVLAFVAGFINAGGFFIVQQYTSHMTGILSIAADNISIGNYVVAISMLIYIGCFILGSFLTTIIVLTAKKHHLHSQYALPLMTEALFIFCVIIIHTAFNHSDFLIPTIIALICFIMGLQNALITKVSTAIIRTTHVTGMVTDLGIELGRFFFNKEYVSFNKAILHLSMISIFFIGGILGAVMTTRAGVYGLAPAAVLLLCITLSSLVKDVLFYHKFKIRNN